jgi:hypothetical protein
LRKRACVQMLAGTTATLPRFMFVAALCIARRQNPVLLWSPAISKPCLMPHTA